MNFRLTLYVQGGLLLFLGAALLSPIPFSIYYRDGQILSFLLASAITSLTGCALFFGFRSRDEMTLREGFAIVTFGWIGFSLFSALPYVISGSLSHPIDAFFESVSGVTTAGASVITNVEANPRSILFWRAMTHWLGGMGIIVLGLAILPFLGVGGMQLFEAEASGPTADRLTPRIQDTARWLWGVYVLLTVLGVLFLWVGDMDFFEAVCHTFAALATGGFSTRNNSLAAFGTYSQCVTIVLMILGGANFSLYYHVLRGRPRVCWQNDEFRFYLGILAVSVALVVAFNWHLYDSVLVNLRDAAFAVSSILTTTGFATADYEHWPMFPQALLVLLTFCGACAGSTSGGLKLMRLLLLCKHAYLETARLLHPRQVRVLKFDRHPVSAAVMKDILGFTVLFLGVYVAGSLLLAAAGVDLLTAGTAVIACLSTTGPGLGAVGPMDNYASLPGFAKMVLCAVMLLGRLEISTVLMLLFPSFWRK
jgi:trk system potassium uptake protein TrkH